MCVPAGDARYHTPCTDVQSSSAPRRKGWNINIVHQKNYTSSESSRRAVSSAAIFGVITPLLLWNIRTLKFGPGGMIACAINCTHCIRCGGTRPQEELLAPSACGGNGFLTKERSGSDVEGSARVAVWFCNGELPCTLIYYSCTRPRVSLFLLIEF